MMAAERRDATMLLDNGPGGSMTVEGPAEPHKLTRRARATLDPGLPPHALRLGAWGGERWAAATIASVASSRCKSRTHRCGNGLCRLAFRRRCTARRTAWSSFASFMGALPRTTGWRRMTATTADRDRQHDRQRLGRRSDPVAPRSPPRRRVRMWRPGQLWPSLGSARRQSCRHGRPRSQLRLASRWTKPSSSWAGTSPLSA